MFLTREKVFDYDNNKYYVQKGKFNVYTGTTRLPNCTTYCKLREAEACDLSAPQKMFTGRTATGFPEAKNWYAETILSKGTKPKEGAIAVFNGNSGHVMFLERLISGTRWLVSESNYDANKNLRNWKFWRVREVDLVVGKATISGVGALIGFIYPEINDKRVSRNTKVDQIEVVETEVNVRTKPGLGKTVVSQGCYCPLGIYNVLEWKELDNYTWARIDTNCWISVGSWAIAYKKGSTDTTKLQAQLKELKAKKSSLETELASVNKQISEIEAKL